MLGRFLQHDIQEGEGIARNGAVLDDGGEDCVERFAKLDGFLKRALPEPGRLACDGEQMFRERVHAGLHSEKYEVVIIDQPFRGIGQPEADRVGEIESQIPAAEIEFKLRLSL